MDNTTQVTSPRDVLIAARKLIEKPEDWGQGSRPRRENFNSCCAAEAIEEVSGPTPVSNLEARKLAFELLRKSAGLPDEWAEIVYWNDEPERTHAEVLAAFDRAIELAGQQ